MASRLLRAGLADLGWRGEVTGQEIDGVPERHRALAARLLMALAYMEAEQGHGNLGLRLLDHAEQFVAFEDIGNFRLQRGTVLIRMGRWAAALAELASAEPLLGDDARRRAAVFLNRGALFLDLGDVRRARGDLRRAGDIAVAAGLEQVAAKAMQNLGYCDLVNGDVPEALHRFDAAAAVYRRVSPGNMPVLETDRARALLAVGLARDAAAALDSAITAFRRQHLDQHCAEAELARAQAALAVGDRATARRCAKAAMRRLHASGNAAWAALAELTALRASPGVALGTWRTSRTGRTYRLAQVGAEAGQLAQRLRAHRLRADAAVAELIAARAFIALGQPENAAQRLAALGDGRSLPLDTLLLRQLARAELAALGMQTNRALAELRKGLTILHTRRGRLGSLDLQTGAAALGAELADAGLRLVLDHGTARQVFSWLERSRAQAFRVKPVRPPSDPEEADVLAELRQLSTMIRNAELNGAPDPAIVARRNELQRLVRQRSWQVSGLGETIAEATPRDVAEALAESGQVYVGILARDDSMLAVSVRGQRTRLIKLGDFAAATEAARRLTADLDALAGRRLPDRLQAVIRESVRRQTEILTEHVIAPLLPTLKDDGAVIVPAGALASVPWSMLPGLRGRPVTIAPSASSWLASWRGTQLSGTRPRRTQPSGRRQEENYTARQPLLVAGPDLSHAVPEVAEIARLYAGSTKLVNQDATVDKTLQALDGADLAHLAAHGHHDRDNVLFSSLDLADGPLMAYDIQRLSTAPKQVVLSACDVGRTVVRPGEEILGFTAALLHIGTPTVISSVTRVADNAAVGLMTAYHRALKSGSRPAEALATVSEPEPFCPFVCFGAG